MKADVIFFAAILFASWMLRMDDDPHIVHNTAAAVCFALAFLFICLLVMQICGYVM